MYLLDSNVVIRLFHHDPHVERFLFSLSDDSFAISMMTRFEILLGAIHEKMTLDESESYLDKFRNIDVDRIVIRESVMLQRENNKKLAFKDLIIAATAKVHNLSLVTSDRDFKNFLGLQVLLF